MVNTPNSFNEAQPLIKDCVSILEEKKAENIAAINISKLNSLFDYFIITTGSSQMHCKALAGYITEFMHSKGLKPRMRPDVDSSWIVIDYNDIVFHIFSEEARAYYQLERLWADGEHLIFR